MPNSIRATDTSTVPALRRRELRLPLSTAARVVLVVTSIGLLLTFASIFWLWNQVQTESERRADAIEHELDKRTAARMAQNAAQTREFNAKLCRALSELPQTPGILDFAAELECP